MAVSVLCWPPQACKEKCGVLSCLHGLSTNLLPRALVKKVSWIVQEVGCIVWLSISRKQKCHLFPKSPRLLILIIACFFIQEQLKVVRNPVHQLVCLHLSVKGTQSWLQSIIWGWVLQCSEFSCCLGCLNPILGCPGLHPAFPSNQASC